MPILEEVKAFLTSYLEGKSNSFKRQAKIALTHWERFTRQKPSDVEPKDVDKFIFEYKKRMKLSSLSVYLFHIGKYLAWAKREDLKEYIMKLRRRWGIKKNAESIDHNDILKMLTKITELQCKLLVRLLLFSEIPIGCLENLETRHIYNEKNYEMRCKDKTISGVFYSDTPKIISERIQKESLEENDRIIGIGEREIQYLIPKYAKKVGIKKKVTPKDLRKIGKDQFKRGWLIEIYNEAKETYPLSDNQI